MSSDRPGIGYRVGFPSNEPTIDLSGWKFLLLDRVLAASDKIKELAGWDGWKMVLDAVRKCETAGEGFESLPEKVRQLIIEGES